MPGGIRKFQRRQRKGEQKRKASKEHFEGRVPADDKNDHDNAGRHENRGAGYKALVRENEMFMLFYKKQKICKDAAEFEEMICSLKQDLPASFRITGYRTQAKALLRIIEGKYFKDLVDLKAREGEAVLPKCLDWYPDNLAYQLNITRNHIRREEVYFKLHNFLVSETESGNISRQETVSMIPPLVLEVQPHHKVLDMCAAPGSKTAQLIEALHAVEDALPEGLVVANDCDNSRCYMLVHQAKRLQSPCYMITNHDAACLPNLQIPSKDGSGLVNMKFDRILCDVPCTGDGTLRKNADIWTKWSPSNGSNLHGVQYRIVKRGLELLAVGGMLVYSTCSLNPVEDEAVLSRILKETGATVHLVDIKDKLPGLVYNQGVSSWTVAGRNKKAATQAEEIEFFDTWEEVTDQMKSQLRPQMFPPTPEEAPELHLDRCIRILPHHQDTGGFFVALLEKTALCPWESTKNLEENGAGAGVEKEVREPPKKKPRFRGYKEDPFVYFKEDEATFPGIKDYYGLSLPCTSFLTRHNDENCKKRNLYFTSPAIRDVVLNNETRVKIINTGVKAFSLCDQKGAKADFRLAQEGALMTIPFIDKRKIYPTKHDLEILLDNQDIDKPPEISSFSEEFKKSIEDVETGSVAMIYEAKDGVDKGLRVEIVGWKGKESLRAYVPKNERLHYLRLIGGNTSKFETNKFTDRKERQSTPQVSEKENGDALANTNQTVETKTEEEVTEEKNGSTTDNGEVLVKNGENGSSTHAS